MSKMSRNLVKWGKKGYNLRRASACSSVEEQASYKRQVVGSIPTTRTILSGCVAQPQRGPFGVAEQCRNKMYYVYFLKSLKDGKYYIGCSSREPALRLQEHNDGLVTSTKNRRPFKLVYLESFNNKKEAFQREWFLKHPKGYLEKLEIIKNLAA